MSAESTTWELDVRPRITAWVGAASAGLLLVLFVVGGILLRASSTGVYFDFVDQGAVVVVGIVLALVLLVLTRPRVRAGADGVRVRNLFGEQQIPWEVVHGVSYPDRSVWPRLELPDDEYIPLTAIQSFDGAHAADAVEKLRELGAKYAPR